MFSQVLIQDIQEITNAMLKSKKVRLLIQREDLNNPHCMGNKWWKLRYNLMEAVRQNQRTILTFGGAFSNHIAATASACNKLGLKSIGIIRGDFTDNLNLTLLRAKNEGMQLQFVDQLNSHVTTTLTLHLSFKFYLYHHLVHTDFLKVNDFSQQQLNSATQE